VGALQRRITGYVSDFAFWLLMLFQTATSHALWIPIKSRTIETAPMPYRLYSSLRRHKIAIANTVA
jgi:hypothetical protein